MSLSIYSLFCKTEQLTLTTYGYKSEAPTKCPRNENHEIDKVAPIDTISLSKVSVVQSPIPNKMSKLITYDCVVPASQPLNPVFFYKLYYNIPENMGIFNISLNTDGKFAKDSISLSMSPFNYIGRSLAPLNKGDTTCKYKALSYLFPGMICRIEDISGSYDMGEIIKISSIDGNQVEVTFSKDAPKNFSIDAVSYAEIPLLNNYVCPKNDGYSTIKVLCPKPGMKSTPASKADQLCLKYTRSKSNNTDHHILINLEVVV